MRAGPQAADHRAGAVPDHFPGQDRPAGAAAVGARRELWAFNGWGPAEWTLDSLAAAAQVEGLMAAQVRRILLPRG